LVAWWAIAVVGLGGGVVNSLLLEENSLILPAIRTEAGRRKLDLGSVNTFIQRNQTRLVAAQAEALDWVLRQMYEERKR
jgi:hypothetical protein